MQFLAFGEIGKLAGSAVQEPFVEPVGFDDRLDQGGVWFCGRRERIGVIDHHPDFLAGAAQLHRLRERQRGLIIVWARVGCGEAIIEKCGEPVWAQMDDRLIRGYVDPVDQGEKDDPHP
jgi:hypothetical protein